MSCSCMNTMYIMEVENERLRQKIKKLEKLEQKYKKDLSRELKYLLMYNAHFEVKRRVSLPRCAIGFYFRKRK